MAHSVQAVLLLCIGKKFGHRELHFTEYRAGVIVSAGLAVLFGQAEAASGKHKLNLAFHSDNRKYADSNVNIACADVIHKAALEAIADELGNSIDAHTAMTEGLAALDGFAVQADRRRNLYHNGRKGRLGVATELLFVEAKAVFLGVRGENRYVLFTAVKDNLLIEGAKSLYLAHSSSAYARLERYAEIIAHGYLIEALIEGYGLDINSRVDNLNRLAPYRACLVDNFLSHIAKMNTYVLEAILVTRRIENLIYTDTAKLFLVIAAKSAKRIVSFNHYYSSLSV